MKASWKLLIVSTTVLILCNSAKADFLNVDVQADYTGSNSRVLGLIGEGTTVVADITLEIGPGTPNSFPSVTAEGSFVWTNGETHTYEVLDGFLSGLGADGTAGIFFQGIGPVVNGFETHSFRINFDIGTNPFTTTEDFSALLLQSSVENIRVGSTEGTKTGSTTSFDSIDGNLTGTITAVPEPTSLALVGFCSGGVLLTRRRR